MMLDTDSPKLIIHGPPGSAPPVMADALRLAAQQRFPHKSPPDLIPMGNDPGVDSMTFMAARQGDTGLISTCTPVFIQAPLLRGMSLTHRDLTPVARLVSDRFFVVVRADSDMSTATDFLSGIVRSPTRTGGYFLGGINHLLALAIADKTGANVEFIVTESEPAVWNALIEGRIEWACGVAAEILPHVEAGTLTVVAALNDSRMPSFPHVPTLAEAGADVSFQLWRGIMAPGGIAPSAVDTWCDYLSELRSTPAWQDYLARNGQTDTFLCGEDFAAFLGEQWDWYERNLGLAHLLPEPAQ